MPRTVEAPIEEELETYRRALTGTATIKYLAPVRGGKVLVRTTLARREGRKLFVHSDAVDQEGRTVATLDEIWIAVAE